MLRTYSSDGSSDDPQNEENEQANRLASEGGDPSVVVGAVNDVNAVDTWIWNGKGVSGGDRYGSLAIGVVRCQGMNTYTQGTHNNVRAEVASSSATIGSGESVSAVHVVYARIKLTIKIITTVQWIAQRDMGGVVDSSSGET